MLAAAVAIAVTFLPSQGIALERGHDVVLRSLGGRQVLTLRGYSVEPSPPHQLFLRSRSGWRYLVDGRRRLIRVGRARRVPSMEPVAGTKCFYVTDAGALPSIQMCARSIFWYGTNTESRVLARAPGPVGHWAWAELSPDHRTVLAQWSAECEIPVAYFVSVRRRSVRPVVGRDLVHAPMSIPLGWLRNNRAVVYFPTAACGSGIETPGVYAVDRAGRSRLLLRAARFAMLAMWGG